MLMTGTSAYLGLVQGRLVRGIFVMMEAARRSSCQVLNASLVDLHARCPLS